MAEKITFFGTHSYDRSAFSHINQEAGFGFELDYRRSYLDLHNAAYSRGARAVCIFVNDRADRPVLELLKESGVEMLALRCAGFNQVDLKAAAALGIKVARVPAYSPHAVAEYTLALIMALNRKVHRAFYRTRDGNFALHGLMGFDMYGKTAGIIGTGKIGRILIKILRGLGMNVVAYDLYPDAALAQTEGFTYVGLDELFARSDIISLHCPLTPETNRIINRDNIAKMKKGVMIVNTGRGQLIDTQALLEGLISGQVGSAGLDVYEEERNYFYADRSDDIITDNVLARLISSSNVLVTSHQAFFTKEAMTNIVTTTLQNCSDFFAGRELVNEVKWTGDKA